MLLNLYPSFSTVFRTASKIVEAKIMNLLPEGESMLNDTSIK